MSMSFFAQGSLRLPPAPSSLPEIEAAAAAAETRVDGHSPTLDDLMSRARREYESPARIGATRRRKLGDALDAVDRYRGGPVDDLLGAIRDLATLAIYTFDEDLVTSKIAEELGCWERLCQLYGDDEEPES